MPKASLLNSVMKQTWEQLFTKAVVCVFKSFTHGTNSYSTVIYLLCIKPEFAWWQCWCISRNSFPKKMYKSYLRVAKNMGLSWGTAQLVAQDRDRWQCVTVAIVFIIIILFNICFVLLDCLLEFNRFSIYYLKNL